MTDRDIRTLTILGAGDMGHGIAELAAMNGFTVRVRDVDEDVLNEARKKVQWSLEKLASHNTIAPEDVEDSLGRLTFTTNLEEACRDTDFVIEAVPENPELKQRVFAEVEQVAPEHAVFASNTSTIRITEIGEKLADKSRIVGMHFFNPVLLMDLVEIIPADGTREDVVRATEQVSQRLGKTYVTLKKDTPGFVTSRLIGVWVGAGVAAAENGLATPQQVDAAMKFKAGFPMGPHELADYTGLDIGVHASRYIASRLGSAYKPAAALADRVDRGDLGKKTGSGFYRWAGHKMAEPLSPDQANAFDPNQVMAVVANEAAKLLEQGVASAEDIDLAMRNGTAFPKGPLEWADDAGLDTVLRTLLELKEKTGQALVEPYPLLVELVEEGNLGKSTGKGFYEHATPDAGAAGTGGPSYETLVVDVDEETRVATVTLDRPHRLNALNDTLIRELGEAFDTLDADDRVRAILLTGNGDKAFCVGADLTDLSGGMTPSNVAQIAREGHLLCLRIEKSRKPVVAAVNGYAFGGGLELTLPCDFRVAAKRAKFALPEVTLGLLPAMGGTQRLPKLIGLANAKEIAMLGDRIDADTAHRYGLVHRVFDNDTFPQEAKAFAAHLAERAPLALGYTKQLLNMAPTTDLAAGMEAESAYFGVLASTEDVMEGIGAMFAKTKPDFKGE